MDNNILRKIFIPVCLAVIPTLILYWKFGTSGVLVGIAWSIVVRVVFRYFFDIKK